MSYDDGGMGDWKPTCRKCFRPEGFVCRCKEIELKRENARLQEIIDDARIRMGDWLKRVSAAEARLRAVLGQNARLKKKLKSIANAAAECLEEREMYWGSVERIEKNNHEYRRLRLAVAEAREEDGEA